MSTPTVEEVSETFIEQQARVTETNQIITEVQSVTVYPFESRWWITFACGDPFEDVLARIPLGETKIEAFKCLQEIYNANRPTLQSVCSEALQIELDASHSIQTDAPPEASLEIESPVLVNSYEGHLSTLPRAAEYYFDARDDSAEIQDQIQTELQLFATLEQCVNSTTPLSIQNTTIIDEQTVALTTNAFDTTEPITFELSLPSIDETKNSPVTEFINSAGSGRIDDIETVYVGYTEDDTVGVDTIFEAYGIAATPCVESESETLISRFVSRFV